MWRILREEVFINKFSRGEGTLIHLTISFPICYLFINRFRNGFFFFINFLSEVLLQDFCYIAVPESDFILTTIFNISPLYLMVMKDSDNFSSWKSKFQNSGVGKISSRKQNRLSICFIYSQHLWILITKYPEKVVKKMDVLLFC